MSTFVPMPMQRGFALVVALALLLSALVPFVAPAVSRAASTDLFISEYIEGSSFNKAIEIYNGTGAAVDLAAGTYTLELHSNGSAAASQSMALTGTVADGDVFVVSRLDASAEIQAQTDAVNAAVINFNGDDAVVLKHAGAVIDVLGQVGFDPGTEWGTDPTSTADSTLVRKATIQDGDTNGGDAFDPSSQWDGYAINTFTFLGSHTVGDEPVPTDPTGLGAASPVSVEVGEQTLLTVAVTPGTNPTSTGLAVSADLTPIAGGAAQPFFDDGTSGDVTAGDGTFSFLTAVGAVVAGDKLITATITDAQTRQATATIELTVEGAPSTIAEIQGAGHLSPLVGEQVFGVEGIVTARRSSSFWMTSTDPDEDAATSEGILVFGATATVGQHVRVAGVVTEFRPGGDPENLTTTELTSPTVEVLSSGNPVPETAIGVDVLPPTEVIEDDATTTVEARDAVFDPAEDGIDFWESLEGMRLSVADAVAVGRRNNFGELAVVSGAQPGAGVRTARGGILVRKLGQLGDYRPGDFNPERIILDDVMAATPRVNVGDEFVTDPVGVLDYSFGNYKLLVLANPGRVDNHLAREVTAPTGSHELAVATFNVENLSAVDGDAKVNELAAQIVNNLRSPDLIAIEEMQDNSGPADTGVVASDLSWQRLIDAIVAAGGPLYDYRQIDPENNADGGAPGGNIRVGFLFHSERGLEFVDRPGGDAVTDTDVVATPNEKGARLTASPGRVLPDPSGPWANAFEDTRKSLVGEFRWRGETLFVVANHLSSKGDDRPLFSAYQPPYRLTEFESYTGPVGEEVEDGWRHAQAQVINDFVDELLAVDEDAHVIVLGDINDFDFSETVGILSGELVALDPGPFEPDADGSGQTAATGHGPILRSLFELLPENERYSYVFDGNSQVLDQILVSTSLFAIDPTYDVVHVNAEFDVQASDHDPSVMRVAFQPRSEP